MTRTLVVGTYPPVPGPAATATLQAVRAELDRDAEVEVVSPRPSAAHHYASLRGSRAALSVAARRRALRADAVVICVEPGVPFEDGSSPWARRRQAALLRAALWRLRRVVLLLPRGLSPDDAPARWLWSRADELVVPTEEVRAGVLAVPGVRDRRVVVVPQESRRGEVRVPEPEAARVPDAVVTVYGPQDRPPPRVRLARARALPHRLRARLKHWFHLAERAAHDLEQTAARWAHTVLGDHAAVVGRPLRAVVNPVRRLILRVTRR